MKASLSDVRHDSDAAGEPDRRFAAASVGAGLTTSAICRKVGSPGGYENETYCSL